MRILRRDQHRSMPWRNGGGSTREVLCRPAGVAPQDADLRLSIADIDASGPFSAFPGLERMFLLAGGGPVTLEIDGHATRVHAGDLLRFDGAAGVRCDVEAPATAVNVMTRRGSCTAEARVVRLDAGGSEQVAPGGSLYVLAVEGGVRVGVPGADGWLGPLDAATDLPPDTALQITAPDAATCLVVRVRPAD